MEKENYYDRETKSLAPRGGGETKEKGTKTQKNKKRKKNKKKNNKKKNKETMKEKRFI